MRQLPRRVPHGRRGGEVAKGAIINATTNNFIHSLSQTLAAANAFLVSQLEEAGLKGLVPSHGDVLGHLFAASETGKHPTMQEIAASIGRDPSTVTALVKKLSDEGYVETRKCPEDLRRTEVHLTKLGASLKGDFERISESLVATQMKGIKPQDFEAMCATLDQVRANFQEANGTNAQ